MSPDDICTACHHPRHRHQDDAGMCIESDTLTILIAPDGTTTGVTAKGVPCHCNLFREQVVEEVLQEPDIQDAIDVSVQRVVDDPVYAWMCTGCGEGIAIGESHICPLDLIPKEFIMAMGRAMRAGLKDDRQAGDWKDLPRLTAANKTANLYIHMDAKEYAEVACNALILWWHFQRTKTAVTIVPGNDKESDHEPT